MTFGVDGVRVGHWTDPVAETGCTVIELPEGTIASFTGRGGAPASREVALLAPDKSNAAIDAVVLTGGSAFGLAAADGVMQYLESAGRGVQTSAAQVPIVPTLALYDLAVGDSSVRPGPAEGLAAAADLRADATLVGRIGAGTGASVSQWRGPDGRLPGGLGHAMRTLGDLRVAALCAVNAVGDIATGETDTAALAGLLAEMRPDDRAHTTIGLVVTNARLTKTECFLVAEGADDGLARAITPPHTRFDGDAFVAAATGQVEARVDAVRMLAVDAVTAAVRSVGQP